MHTVQRSLRYMHILQFILRHMHIVQIIIRNMHIVRDLSWLDTGEIRTNDIIKSKQNDVCIFYGNIFCVITCNIV